jgi:predicted transposase YbfD/YdcC
MTRQGLALIEVFSAIPDFRQARGKRHPLPAILALAAAAMLCGSRSYSAIAEWGRNYGRSFAAALGFTNGVTPCAATLHAVFRHLDKQHFEERLGGWAEAVLSASPTAELEAAAIDGKSLRGSQRQGAAGAHLLSALSHRLGLTLLQRSVPEKTNEISAANSLLSGLTLKGRVITMDALLTQRKLAEAICTRGGDYVMMAKANQPELRKWIEALFDEPQWLREEPQVAHRLDLGHGRIEECKLQASSALSDHGLWPGLEQVFAIERKVTQVKGGAQRQEVVYGCTSLSPERASAEMLLKLVRGHWQIENKSHWVRDVTYGEDRSQVRKGNIPQVMAALRNAVIGLMRNAGEANIAAACRKFAAQPQAALALIGLEPKN